MLSKNICYKLQKVTKVINIMHSLFDGSNMSHGPTVGLQVKLTQSLTVRKKGLDIYIPPLT